MTDNGLKVHRIYEVFDAYALSIEMSFLDTTTIKQRYNQLNEECKGSEYARKVEEHLIKSGANPTAGNTLWTSWPIGLTPASNIRP